jgi:thioredoxin 1
MMMVTRGLLAHAARAASTVRRGRSQCGRAAHAVVMVARLLSCYRFCYWALMLRRSFAKKGFAMITRRSLMTMAAASVFTPAGVLTPATAFAAEELPFTRQAFQAAQKDGKSILVEIHASWCPTCQAQKPILGKLFADPKFKNLAVFRVDFDSQKDEVRNFKARIQSTLITFKGNEEVARSVGDTNAASIADLLALAL